MTLFKNIRLGMIHMAVAVSLVPITSVLNRIMIHELGILASLVAALIVLPHLLSPLQMVIGRFSDTHPLWGYRRTPYIALGLILCVGGSVLTPLSALAMDANFWPGLAFALAAFLTWGFGYNLAVVSYLSLASDLSTEEQRPRTIAVMWFMMITAVIATAIISGRVMEHYDPGLLLRVFFTAGGIALALGFLGLIGLEPRNQVAPASDRHSIGAAIGAVVGNPQARAFFVYLTLLLAAILGQDVLLEPFGAQAFGMNVRQTTQLTAVWGGATLLALLTYGFVLSRFLSKKVGATLGASLAATGFFIITLSGLLHLEPLFVPGIAILGFGTGIATTSNLALMLDMTTPANAGLFIGAWGVADAAARGVGNFMAGVVRDVATSILANPVAGYAVVFLLEGLILCVALVLLRRIDPAAFRNQQEVSLSRLIAVAGDA